MNLPRPIFQFSNVVVVENDKIGVVVKTWGTPFSGYEYEVYVREFNSIMTYKETHVKHYVYSKSLSDEEKEFH